MEQGAKDFLRGGAVRAFRCRTLPSAACRLAVEAGLLPSAAVPGYGFSAGAGCVGPGMIAVRTAFPVISACGVCGLRR